MATSGVRPGIFTVAVWPGRRAGRSVLVGVRAPVVAHAAGRSWEMRVSIGSAQSAERAARKVGASGPF
jgi:hypothetical protein